MGNICGEKRSPNNCRRKGGKRAEKEQPKKNMNHVLKTWPTKKSLGTIWKIGKTNLFSCNRVFIPKGALYHIFRSVDGFH